MRLGYITRTEDVTKGRGVRAQIAILSVPESEFGERLATAVEARGCGASVVSIDAPSHGSVTARPSSLLWDGVDLLRADVLFVELPVFSWPQPLAIRELPAEEEARARAITADREARSLMDSAVWIAAESRAVVNRPGAAFLASSPGVALDDLAAKEIPVHPWTLSPAPGDDVAGGRIVLDAVSRDRWHRPSRPPAGDPAIVLEPVHGSVTNVLVVGGRAVGALHYASAAAWADGRGSETLKGEKVPEPEAALAGRAASALDLEIAAVTMTSEEGSLRVLNLEAGPDLSYWDRQLDGVAVNRIAERLCTLASKPKGART